jgi:GNAT superfamily N-acetyltransferase
MKSKTRSAAFDAPRKAEDPKSRSFSRANGSPLCPSEAGTMASNEESIEIGGVSYARETSVSAGEFIDLLMRSGLGRHRPIQDRSRIERMLANSNFIVSARLAGSLIGVVRGVTDAAWCCYLSDVAVDAAFQGRGIGRHLMEQARREAGAESMCLLLAYPDAANFYQSIGMQRFADAFLLERDR